MNQPILQLQSNQTTPFSTEQDDRLDFHKIVDFIIDNRWLIASVALVVTLLGAAYALVREPVYKATILIQVEESSASARNVNSELSSVFDLKTGSSTEIEVLRSRKVVSPAVEQTRFYINAQPKYFPGIGSWIAGRHKQLSEPGLFGYGGYAWGAESADASVFNVPKELEGRAFRLTAGANGSYRLVQKDEGIQIDGQVGQTLNTRVPHGVIELRVDKLAANPGAQFLLTRSSRLETVEKLQKALKISEKGKQSGVIEVALAGTDPKRATIILNEIARQYIRQNDDRKSEVAEKLLASLDRQLPQLKQELQESEGRYNERRKKHGTIDLGEEAKGILQLSITAKTRMVELRQKKEELLGRYEEEHPAVEAVNQQIRALNRELASIDARIKMLPEIEQDVVRLKRDVQVNTDVYTAVLSTAQQLRLVSASKVGYIRLLDPAEPPVKPIEPTGSLFVAVAAAVGLLLGTLVAFLRKAFYGRVNDPQEIEEMLGLAVTATIPHSAGQKRLQAQIKNERTALLDNEKRAVAVLSHGEPSDGAVEGLRRFRSSLQCAMQDSKNNIIVIAGPTPAVGKSFVSANFATVLASIGKKVLLIDGDLRTGRLHRYFGIERKRGLSDAISEGAPLDQVIRRNVVENVDFISTGSLPSNPAELLAHTNFGKLLQLLSTRYDFILIDTAPVLAASDALIVAPHAGATFNVVRDGVTTMSEIEAAIKQFSQVGATVTGIVFNDSKSRSARYDYGYVPKHG
jgi:tyrosine-protein kinase Etk/Wzc